MKLSEKSILKVIRAVSVVGTGSSLFYMAKTMITNYFYLISYFSLLLLLHFYLPNAQNREESGMEKKNSRFLEIYH